DALRKATFTAIDAGFSQRRKTLRQALATWAGSAAAAEEKIVAAGLSPKARAEELSIHDFVSLAKVV
ncbi:MAG: 16S rRNA (adenine(1518)-N(6)/adenine(1519)-N(6))-dimethyltransferase, partial [Actinomycetes bacterium]